MGGISKTSSYFFLRCKYKAIHSLSISLESQRKVNAVLHSFNIRISIHL